MTVVLEKTSGLALKTFDVMVDYDDVVVPWFSAVDERAVREGFHDGSVPCTTWRMWEHYGCDQDAWHELVIRATHDGLYTHTDPFPYAVDAINSLLWRGHRVHIVTARGDDRFPVDANTVQRWTHDHIERYGIGYTTLTFGAKDKLAAMHELGVVFDFAIDDGGHNYDRLHEAGIPVWLMRAPHNGEHVAERRIGSLWEFAQMIHREAAA